MAEPNQQREEEDLQAPEQLVEALHDLQKERIFVPPTVDEAVLRRAREHVRLLERPRSRWKPWLSWAAMAACLALAAWLAERFNRRPFAREDINRDGRVDVLDAFSLARHIEAGGILDPRWDFNGDGRVDRADVNAIGARAVSLAQAGPAPKRSAELKQNPEGAQALWRTEVRVPFLSGAGLRVNVLPASCRQQFSTHPSAELNSRSICPNCRRPRRFCGARLCEPQHVESDRHAGFVKALGGWRSSCGSQTRAPLVAAPLRWAVSQSCTRPTAGKCQHAGKPREDHS